MEERDGLAAKNIGLKDELKQRQSQIAELRDDLSTLRTKLKYHQSEKIKVQRAQEEATEAKAQLQMYKNIDEVVKGSIGEVNAKLHEIGDFSPTSQQLSIIIVALKKEMKLQVRYILNFVKYYSCNLQYIMSFSERRSTKFQK